MAESTASKNERLSDYAADITSISLHSADPGTTGANEITGGAPAYARKTPAWGAPASGVMNLSSALSFDVPGGAVVAFVGYWKAGVFFNGVALSATETFVGQGIYQLTSAQITAT